MPRIKYIEKRFHRKSEQIITMANNIAAKYAKMGYDLTLRQLYYQFIALDYFPNNEKNYKRLGEIINDARLAGLFDWNYLKDRGRQSHGAYWAGHEPPAQEDIIRSSNINYSVDMWEGQDRRVEVWVEKQALEQVVQRAATGFRTGYFACKGYVSQSEMWTAAQRLLNNETWHDRPTLILHLGDHDPSGIDMTRDIEERLQLFGAPIEVKRIALNMDQVEQYSPPPNPAKITDSRYQGYRDNYGPSSWELDALNPDQLNDLIVDHIKAEIDWPQWRLMKQKESDGRQKIIDIADRWDDIEAYLNDLEED